jgi:hypothetical protein
VVGQEVANVCVPAASLYVAVTFTITKFAEVVDRVNVADTFGAGSDTGARVDGLLLPTARRLQGS